MGNVINTNNGTDFTSVYPIILVNTSGYALSNPSIKVIDTSNGVDFTSVRPVILVNTSGVSIS